MYTYVHVEIQANSPYFIIWNNSQLLCSGVQEHRDMYRRLPNVSMFGLCVFVFKLVSETTEPTEAKFHMEPPCDMGGKFIQMFQVIY